ncbi:MAG: acylneuraminate cytidylyltransferase family protein [Candidatus Sedimenticola sp. PURPLELP]
MNNIAFIPARGGSKSIPRKNLVPLLNKPLIQYTIDSALQASCIDRIVVSSDNHEILHFSQSLSVEILNRPAELAEDDTPTFHAILHAIEALELHELKDTNLILLQPTSPLRTASHIDQAYKLFESSNATQLISVFEPKHSPLKSFLIDNDGYLHGITDDETPFKPRQQLPKTYYPNGAISIIKLDSIIRTEKLSLERCIPFIMSADLSIDIDSYSDLNDAEEILRSYK